MCLVSGCGPSAGPSTLSLGCGWRSRRLAFPGGGGETGTGLGVGRWLTSVTWLDLWLVCCPLFFFPFCSSLRWHIYYFTVSRASKPPSLCRGLPCRIGGAGWQGCPRPASGPPRLRGSGRPPPALVERGPLFPAGRGVTEFPEVPAGPSPEPPPCQPASKPAEASLTVSLACCREGASWFAREVHASQPCPGGAKGSLLSNPSAYSAGHSCAGAAPCCPQTFPL